ncbi:MAG: glycosyltransferase [Candidatus Omnitrophica bacterium]|nr:glycosyltransferase [Candidatus Omnitrophota bacterium]
MKKIHIFHISEFGGHNKAAQNLKEALLYKNPQLDVITLNGFGYFYPRGEKIINSIYIMVIKHFPHLWGRAYDRRKVAKVLAPYRKIINKFAFSRLHKLTIQHPPSCFVATQAFPCGLIADFKAKENLDVPLVAIVTDYHPNRFWVHPFVDRYIVACQEAKDVLISEGVSADKVKILGIPISVKFLTTYPKTQISKELGFMSGLDTVLIMGGGLGIGPIKVIAKKLDSLKHDFQIIVVCGRNKKLHNWFLRKETKFKKPLFVFGYTEDIHKVMDFSDIIITKGGGITISEALAKGMCIITTHPIPGQEERNVKYLSKMQAVIEANHPKEIGEVVEKLLKNKKEMYSLREKAKENSLIDSSLRIVDLILELVS